MRFRGSHYYLNAGLLSAAEKREKKHAKKHLKQHGCMTFFCISFHSEHIPYAQIVVICVYCVCREFVEKMKVFTQFQTSAELERLQEGLLSESLSVCLSSLLSESLSILSGEPTKQFCLQDLQSTLSYSFLRICPTEMLYIVIWYY